MDVLKRSEFCGVSKVNKAVSDVLRVKDIKRNTIFTGFVDTYPESSIWMRTSRGIVRLSGDGPSGAGYNLIGANEFTVRCYEVLNATLVIDD